MKRLLAKKRRFEEPGHYTEDDREKIPLRDFGDPENRRYPIVTQQDVYDAARLIGHAEHPRKVKERIIEISKRKGFKIPKSWQREEERREKKR